MKSRRTILAYTAVAVLLSTRRPAEAAGYVCTYRNGRSPVMDGRIEGDPFWEHVPFSSILVRLGSDGKPAPAATQFKIAYTEEALYAAVRCDEPNMDGLKVTAKPGGEVWNDDSVEIFLSSPAVDPYLHLIANTAGTRYNAEGKGPVELGRWEAERAKHADSYSVEVRLPYAVLGACPVAGAYWLGNVGRNHRTGVKSFASSWAPVRDGFHDEANFAQILFPVGVECPEIDERLRDGIDTRCADILSVVEALDHKTFEVRILIAELRTFRGLAATADRRMLFRLRKAAGKLATAAETLEEREWGSSGLFRLARLLGPSSERP